MKRQKKVVTVKTVLFFGIFLFVLFGFTVYLIISKKQQIPDIFIQKNVNKIKLPACSKMPLPVGFTTFESKTNSSKIYHFVKYVPQWKNNNFVKIDLTIVNKKKLNFKNEKFGESKFDFDEKVIKPKIEYSNQLKNFREKFNEEGQQYEIYDIDYSQFKPQYAVNGIINNRMWRRYTLQCYEPQKNSNIELIKIWSNIYTVYKEYIYIFDYICYSGIKINNNKIPDEYSESAHGIDKLTQELIRNIEFKIKCPF